jgi:hypothetical protein
VESIYVGWEEKTFSAIYVTDLEHFTVTEEKFGTAPKKSPLQSLNGSSHK